MSPPNATHRAAGGDEPFFANVVAIFFLKDNVRKLLPKIIVGGSVAQTLADVVLGDTEEAGAHFAICGEAQAIAMATERFGYRGNDSDFAYAIWETPSLRSLGLVLALNRKQFESPLNSGKDFFARNNEFFEPDAC